MTKLLRLLLYSFFLLAACEDNAYKEPAAEEDKKIEEQQDSVADSTGSTPTDTLQDSLDTVSTPADTIPEIVPYYYPAIDESVWETVSPDSLGWNIENLQSLLS